MDKELTNFLPSPKSNELVVKKRASKHRRLPKYIPFKTIYEEKDLSKLTPRQQIMVIKYREAMSQSTTGLFFVPEDVSSLEYVPKNRKASSDAKKRQGRSDKDCSEARKSGEESKKLQAMATEKVEISLGGKSERFIGDSVIEKSSQLEKTFIEGKDKEGTDRLYLYDMHDGKIRRKALMSPNLQILGDYKADSVSSKEEPGEKSLEDLHEERRLNRVEEVVMDAAKKLNSFLVSVKYSEY